jgi:hypothetical protein
MRFAFLERSAAIFNETFSLKHLRSSFPQEPNAAPQPLPEAGTTQERTLEAVGCRRLFGSAGEPIVEPVADPLIV